MPTSARHPTLLGILLALALPAVASAQSVSFDFDAPVDISDSIGSQDPSHDGQGQEVTYPDMQWLGDGGQIWTSGITQCIGGLVLIPGASPEDDLVAMFHLNNAEANADAWAQALALFILAGAEEAGLLVGGQLPAGTRIIAAGGQPYYSETLRAALQSGFTSPIPPVEPGSWQRYLDEADLDAQTPTLPEDMPTPALGLADDRIEVACEAWFVHATTRLQFDRLPDDGGTAYGVLTVLRVFNGDKNTRMTSCKNDCGPLSCVQVPLDEPVPDGEERPDQSRIMTTRTLRRAPSNP